MDKTIVEPYFWWTSEHKELAKKVTQFVDDHYEEAEHFFWKKKFPHELIKKVAAEGFFGPGVPKKYGGLDLGATGSCIAAEQLGRLYAVGHIFTVSMLAGLEQILRFGTEEQKNAWLPNPVRPPQRPRKTRNFRQLSHLFLRAPQSCSAPMARRATRHEISNFEFRISNEKFKISSAARRFVIFHHYCPVNDRPKKQNCNNYRWLSDI